MDKIKENNKLIAEFMEESLSPNEGVIYLDVDHPQFNYHGDTCGLYKHNSRMYHNSWDWLMPVIEKIEMLPEVLAFTISTNYIEIEPINEEFDIHFIKWEDTKPIITTYKVVVEFIKWYNEQNK